MIKNDKTESEIFARIKQSLDTYEEPYIPGSWETFLQIRKKKNRNLFLRIASGIAACLLLGYLGFLVLPTGKRDLTRSTEQQIAVVRKDTSAIELLSKKEPILASAAPATGVRMVSTAGVMAVAPVAEKIIAVQKAEKPAIEVTNFATATEPANETASTQTGKETPTPKSSIDTIHTAKELPKVAPTASPLEQVIPKEEKNMASASRHRIRFGINFSPGVSNAQSTNSLNYMGGISADIFLSSRFQLSTGLQVENQNMVKNLPGIVASSNYPQNQTKTKLINLDLPLNLTWKFKSEKSHAYYVSAGLSSLVYLSQENKNTTYSQDLTPASSFVNGVEVKYYNVVDQISVTQNTVSPNQTFDFAGRINFMIGFEKKLSDQLFIHFEPYTKIPTSGQAAGSLNHTTTGINFKISF